jgi:hypothetical protein
MRTIIDLGTYIPGFYDAMGEMVERDEDGMLYAPCSRCGKEIASHCAYDVVAGRMCNECCTAPEDLVVDPEISAMVDELLGE